MKKIFLDFDGVLFDTVKEAYVVTMLTDKRYLKFDEIDFSTVFFEKFKFFRYLISPAWNYKYLLESLDSSDYQVLENDYNYRIIRAKDYEYEIFEKMFFETRISIKKSNYKKWLKLNRTFSFFDDVKYLFESDNVDVYIITTKDKKTVLDLLSLEKVNFDPSKIYDKSDYKTFGSKSFIISNLLENDEKAIFIDDSSKHINDCKKNKNLICLQPDWGYVNSENVLSKSKILQIIENFLKGS